LNLHLEEMFADKNLTDKIKKRLPYLFAIAELESSRAGKIGMEVGSVREKIVTSLLIYRFGGNNVQTDLSYYRTRSRCDAIWEAYFCQNKNGHFIERGQIDMDG